MVHAMNHNERLRRRALRLSYLTVGYNVLEGVVAVAAGAAAGSSALLGFGMDSFVESISGGVMIWRFRGAEEDECAREKREGRALKLVAYAFFVLGAWVLWEAGEALWRGQAPEHSPLGIAITALSLVVMPLLFVAKYRTGKAMGARSLVADSKQTLGCLWMSAAVLVGLGLNGLFGLWQADPVIGLAIGAWLIKEGREALEHGKLCAC